MYRRLVVPFETAAKKSPELSVVFEDARVVPLFISQSVLIRKYASPGESPYRTLPEVLD
jgi:hypothetical protein